MDSFALDHDFRSDVGFWVHRAAHRFERAMNNELSASSLTYRQCQVLGWIAMDGELAQVELAERMNVEPPTLVRVLDGMERAGLIERVACTDDRRRKVIRATAKAVPVLQKIVDCANRVQGESVRGLSSEEEDALRRLLRKVHDNLDGPAACRGSRPEIGTSRPRTPANGHPPTVPAASRRPGVVHP